MQVDTPTRLYDRPANTFVAGFLGSPEMNLKPAHLTRQNGGPALRVGGFDVPLPADMAQRLAGRTDGDVMLGIRPPFVELAKPDAGGAVEGTLKFVEFMGHEVFIYFDLDGEEYTAVNRIENPGLLKALKVGERARFRLLMDRAHVFDPRSGLNLTLPMNA